MVFAGEGIVGDGGELIRDLLVGDRKLCHYREQWQTCIYTMAREKLLMRSEEKLLTRHSKGNFAEI